MNPEPYREFDFLQEICEELHLTPAPWHVRRGFVAVEGLREVSVVAWGSAPAELVFIHGVGQNAHTFDTVALALERPMLCLDLPGHGHSDEGPPPWDVRALAEDVAVVLEQMVGGARPYVGMSLGGLVGIALARRRPDLVSELVLLDITPGVNEAKASAIFEFLNGPAAFDSFDDLLARTVAFYPERSVASLRRGILHNALQRDDGMWVWRHQRHPRALRAPLDLGWLWDDLGELRVPLTLVRGDGPGSVVTDDDVEELRRRRPDATVHVLTGAGHSLQGDQPLALAALLRGLAT